MKKEQYVIITYLLFFVVTVSFMFILYNRNEQTREYEYIQYSLEQIKELDARIDKDLLRNLSFYLSNYDTLAQSTIKTRELQNQITEQSQSFSSEVPLFSTSLAQYKQQSQNKFKQLERIKSLSSSIKNTLQYLPTAVSELSLKITDSDSDHHQLTIKIYRLLNILLDYNIAPSPDKEQILEKQIQQLEKIHEEIAQHKLKQSLKNILSHIRANLAMKSQMELLLATYDNINAHGELVNLQLLHSDYFTQQNKNSYKINIILITLSFILFIVLGAVLQGLKRIHTKAKMSHARLHDALESINEAFALFDQDNRLLLWNRQFEHYYPTIKDRLRVGISYSKLMAEASERGQFLINKKEMNQSLEKEIITSSRELEHLSDGRCYLSSDSKTSSGGTTCVRVDITDQVKLEEKIIWQASYDSLTSLPNRTLFFDRLSQTIEHAKRESSICALLFIDLDKFKNVNDTLGHDIGDKLLVSASKRLISSVRKIDTVSRLGGDEFTIILQDISSAHDAANISSQIIKKLEERFIVEGNEIHIGASIGITLYPNDADTPTQLLSNADMSMYRAKDAGRNTYRFYTEDMNKDILARLQLEKDMHRALSNNEFFIEYQPIIDSHINKVTHAEALVRWMHPVHGRLLPNEFIHLAEESGLIEPLGEWVLRQAVKQVALWQKSDLIPLSISVNVSSRQFSAGVLLPLLQKLLTETSLPSGSIILEMTESLLIEGSKQSHNCLDTLKQLGIKVSIDDFGTGYSSLSYLKQFPLDILKIDKSFIQDITEDIDDAKLTSAIIDLAHNFNLQVVAEGVETIGQLDFLKQHGCDLIQGYYYSQSLMPEEFLAFCQKHNNNPVPYNNYNLQEQ